MSKGTKFSRRTLLARAGLAAAASPFLPLLNVSAAEPTPKRLLLFYTPHGTIMNNWKPTGSGTSMTLSPILRPLERHKSQLTVLSGISLPGRESDGPAHTKGLPILWTGSKLEDDGEYTRTDCGGVGITCTYGWNTAKSVDQLILDTLYPGRAPTDRRSLEFGTIAGYPGKGPATRMIYSGPSAPRDPMTDPWSTLNTLFSGPIDATDAEKLRRKRRSALDVVHQELDALRSSAPAQDRAKMEAHLDQIRAIETRLESVAGVCMAPSNSFPRSGVGGYNVWPKPAGADANTFASMPKTMDANFDLLTAAFACDMTRVASYQHSVADIDRTVHTWLGHSREHHSMSHGLNVDANVTALTQVYTWYATKFAELLDRLKAVPEMKSDGSMGSMLDNTLVVWGSEVANGNHEFTNVPFILAGGAGGAVAPRGLIEVPAGTMHGRLLVAVAHAMGATTIDKVGNLDHGTGLGPLSAVMS